MRPCISVILPVFNGEMHLVSTIKSILNQTFTDFELIIMDDASIDKSFEEIKKIHDNRIKVFSNKFHKGVSLCRNIGNRIARGKYICAFDNNVKSLPNRLELQFNFMEANPDIGLAGSGIRYIETQTDNYIESDCEILKIQLLKENCIANSSTIIRRDLVLKHNLYYEDIDMHVFDYDFLSRVSSITQITNIQKILLELHLSSKKLSDDEFKNKELHSDLVRLNQLKKVNVKFSNLEKTIYLRLIKGEVIHFEDKIVAQKTVKKFLKNNKTAGFFNQAKLKDFFNGLFSLQPFIRSPRQIEFAYNVKKQKVIQKDLKDVTFIFPLRVESYERLKNIETTIQSISRAFNTQFLVVEAGKKQHYNSLNNPIIKHYFIYDTDRIFHHTYYRNLMLKKSTTPFAAIWDTDAIVNPNQIIEALKELRSNRAALAYPYDGRYYSLDAMFSKLFAMTFDYDLLHKNLSSLELMYGHHSTGGAFIVDAKKYLEIGGENEKIKGWGQEDSERLKRFEIFNFPIYRAKGPLFHLWHPRGENSWFVNEKSEIANRIEYLKTCMTLQNFSN